MLVSVDGHNQVLFGEDIDSLDPAFHAGICLCDFLLYFFVAVLLFPLGDYVVSKLVAKKLAHEESGEYECFLAYLLWQDRRVEYPQVVVHNGVV